MACLFGHKWNGCKCEKCGVTRNKGHKFVSKGSRSVSWAGGVKREGYFLECAICGKESPTMAKDTDFLAINDKNTIVEILSAEYKHLSKEVTEEFIRRLDNDATQKTLNELYNDDRAVHPIRRALYHKIGDHQNELFEMCVEKVEYCSTYEISAEFNKITDSEILEKFIRLAATTIFRENSNINYGTHRDYSEGRFLELAKMAAPKIIDPHVLTDLVCNVVSNVRSENKIRQLYDGIIGVIDSLFERITDENMLVEIAEKANEYFGVRAVQKITDKEKLIQLSKYVRTNNYTYVRESYNRERSAYHGTVQTRVDERQQRKSYESC